MPQLWVVIYSKQPLPLRVKRKDKMVESPAKPSFSIMSDENSIMSPSQKRSGLARRPLSSIINNVSP